MSKSERVAAAAQDGVVDETGGNILMDKTGKVRQKFFSTFILDLFRISSQRLFKRIRSEKNYYCFEMKSLQSSPRTLHMYRVTIQVV